MEKMRVLVANEPRTYREVLVDALRVLRPQVEVSAVASYDLATEIERLRPHLVVCSWLSTAMPVGPLSWVVLYPHEENRAEVFTAGEHATIAGVGFGDFLAIIDRTELLCRAS
jgi:hypothetical protein